MWTPPAESSSGLPEPQNVDGFTRGIDPEGLSDVRTGDEEYIARIQDGGEIWRQPIEELFGPGYSTDGGWAWRFFPERELLVGMVGREVIGSATSPQQLDLSGYATVAVDAPTGRLVWRDRGSIPYCAETLPLLPAREDGAPDVAPITVRCRYAGEMTLSAVQDPAFANLDVILEGFDLPTGRTTWTLPLGAAEGLGLDGGVGAISGAEEILLPTPGGPIIVNLRTGATREPAADQVLLCSSETVQFDYSEPYYVDDTPIRERSGGTLSVPCGPDGAATNDPVPNAAIEAVAVKIADRYILATEAGLLGYELP